MVKVIATKNREILANFEVAQLVAQHQEAEKKKSKVKRVANKAGKGPFHCHRSNHSDDCIIIQMRGSIQSRLRF